MAKLYVAKRKISCMKPRGNIVSIWKWNCSGQNFVNLLTSLANNYVIFERTQVSVGNHVIDKLENCRSVINGISHICGISNKHEQC